MSTGHARGINATAATPAFSFTGDNDNGMYLNNTNELSFATAGTERLRIVSTGEKQSVADGTAALPAWSFVNDVDMGMWRSAADQLSLSTAGTERLRIVSTGEKLSVADGTAALPAWSFVNDPDVGMFRSAANTLALSTAGTSRTVIGATGAMVHTSASTVIDASESVGTNMGNALGAYWGLNVTPATDGIGYGAGNLNYGILGMVTGTRQYSFGIVGQTVNINRCGAVQGLAPTGVGAGWGSLGYRSSGGVGAAGYFTAAVTVGAGLSSGNATNGLGIACYSDFIGSIVKSEMIGQVSIGEMMAAYNLGNEYTSGYKADIVNGESSRSVAFSNSSTELKIYSDGSATLNNGGVFVKFEEAFVNLYSKSKLPTITVSPMGQCNGLYIASVEKDGFWVKELNNGSSNVQFSWIAIGKRIDVVEIPTDILDKNFDKNLKKVIVNEDNKEAVGSPVWWDGNKIIFNQPAPEFKGTPANTPKIYNPEKR